MIIFVLMNRLPTGGLSPIFAKRLGRIVGNWYQAGQQAVVVGTCEIKVKSAYEPVVHQASAYHQFLYHKPTRGISTPPGRGASPSQGYP